MAFDAFILAANSASYVAPAGPPAGAIAFFAGKWGYGRAKTLERNVIGWTVFCALLGPIGFGIFWLLTRREAQRANDALAARDYRKIETPSPLPTWQPNWDAANESSVRYVEPIEGIGDVSVWSDTGASPRLLKKINRHMQSRVLDDVNDGHYHVELPDGTVGYVWADDVKLYASTP